QRFQGGREHWVADGLGEIDDHAADHGPEPPVPFPVEGRELHGSAMLHPAPGDSSEAAPAGAPGQERPAQRARGSATIGSRAGSREAKHHGRGRIPHHLRHDVGGQRGAASALRGGRRACPLVAMGDVQATAALISYYCDAMERNGGFQKPMGHLSDAEHNQDVLRPYGVWAVISPFNFPMALAGGPVGAALVAGNTVVLKPSNQGYLTGLKLYEVMIDAGVPTGAFHVLTGPGASVGEELYQSPDVDGLTFTGSYAVGMQIYRNFAKDYPKPAICEMGGKNPAIVSANADLDKATDGVMRSAFGYSGQKCSACSRVYVERPVFDDFTRLLVEKASKLKVGNPTERDTYTGPVINDKAVQTFQRAVEDVRSGGGTVLLGGERITEGDLGRGNFVQPT